MSGFHSILSKAAGTGQTCIKICCIQNAQEARLALETGAHALGLVGKMPNGVGPIDDDSIAAIAAKLDLAVPRFLLTSKTRAREVSRHVERCGTNVVQLVDQVEPDTYEGLRQHHPGLAIVQVVHVEDESALDQSLRNASHVDALLLDSGTPSARVRTLGGTGNTHDWSISRQIVQRSEVPVFLAGGLNPDNVVAAIEAVGPFGVDVCSGLRRNGVLDEDRLRLFVDRIRQADEKRARSTTT